MSCHVMWFLLYSRGRIPFVNASACNMFLFVAVICTIHRIVHSWHDFLFFFFFTFFGGGRVSDTDQNYHFVKPFLPALVQHQLYYICKWALLHCLQIIIFLNLRSYTDGMNFLIAPKQRQIFSLSLAVSVIDTV